jgi:hypothetical protein
MIIVNVKNVIIKELFKRWSVFAKNKIIALKCAWKMIKFIKIPVKKLKRENMI